MPDVLKNMEPYYFDQDVGRVFGVAAGAAIALVIFLVFGQEFVAALAFVLVFSLVKLEVSRRQVKQRQAQNSPEARDKAADEEFTRLTKDEQDLLRHFVFVGTNHMMYERVPSAVSGSVALLMERQIATEYYNPDGEPSGIKVCVEMYDAAARVGGKDADDVPF